MLFDVYSPALHKLLLMDFLLWLPKRRHAPIFIHGPMLAIMNSYLIGVAQIRVLDVECNRN